MGNRCLNIYDKTDYTRKIYQTIKSTTRVPLTDGIYRMTCKVKRGSGFSELYMYASSAGATYKTDLINDDGTWHETVIEKVTVSGGEVEVGFYADGASGNWARIDDVTLVKIGEAEANGISKVTNPMDDTRQFYSPCGIRSNRLCKGLNIVREVKDGKEITRKVIVR